ncbi:MAG: redoxin domain-containing protein [Verrucomicrobiales bacterium]
MAGATIRGRFPLPGMRTGGLILALFFICSMCQPAAGQAPTPPATGEVQRGRQHWNFTDVEGKEHAPFADESVRFLVVVFIATDCPIANYYQPTINRLAERYREKGVRFLLFHPDPDVTQEKIREHAKAFKISPPVFADTKFALARRLKASATPEAFVIARDGSTKYRGRIDDIYAAWGKRRRKPTSHDLQEALDAVLAGKTVASPTTKPIGCYIPLELPTKDGAAEREKGSN